MKRTRIALLSIVGIVSLVSFNFNDYINLDTSIYNEEINKNAVANNEIVLNLTSIGLYQNKKGDNLAEYYLENTITLNLAVGDSLPLAKDITSSVSQVKFLNWVYYAKDGELSSTAVVVEGYNFYQAYFEYDSSLPSISTSTTTTDETSITSDSSETTSNDTSTGGDSSSTSIDENLTRIYFMDEEWWNSDAATTSIHYWGADSEYSTVWAGTRMYYKESIKTGNKGEYTDENGVTQTYDKVKNVWYFDIDLSRIDGLLFTRTDSSLLEGESAENKYWGAKTIDIDLSNLTSNNLIILDQAEALWGDPGCNVKFATYIEGKLDY